MNNRQKKDYIDILKFCECIKFGNFTLKSGKTSNVYCDLRGLPSHCSQFKYIVQGVGLHLGGPGLESIDLVCGVPHGAVPLATAVAYQFDKPLIWCRKEAKEHGTKKMIEGKFEKGQKVLVIEDVTTTGGSILECIKILENEGLEVGMVYVLVDRRDPEKRKGDVDDHFGEEFLNGKYHIKSLLDLSDLQNGSC